MMLTNIDLIAIDYETVEVFPDGSTVASTEFYRPTFRVASAAFSWFDAMGVIQSTFFQGEGAVRQALLECKSAKVVAHNLPFEVGVTKCRFPDIQVNWYADTMRLAQNYDNGGDKNAFEVVVDPDQVLEDGDLPELKKISTAGLGLVKCAYRILGEQTSHKEKAYGWIREHVPGSKGKEGSFLDRLPGDLLREYNVADTEITLRLYRHITDYFASIAFDWHLDHRLFMSTLHHIVGAKIRGVPVDREKAKRNAAEVEQEIRGIELKFAERFSKEIAAVEADRLTTWVAKVKTEKGREKRLARYHVRDPKVIKEVQFNTGSNKQLAALFIGKLGIEPKFFTKKGAPAFKSAFLGQWGEGGEMLKTRRKRLLVFKQLDALLKASEYDGRWHPDLKLSATATGRAAGGSY